MKTVRNIFINNRVYSGFYHQSLIVLHLIENIFAKNHHLLLFVCLSLLIYACFPEPLDVEGVPSPDNQVVVNSQIVPDQFLAVSITRNFSALTAGPQSNIDSFLTTLLISDLEIHIRADGQTYIMDSVSEGIYGLDELPQEAGTLYELSFINPFNGDTTRASTTMMEFVGFESLETSLLVNEFDTLLDVQYSLIDPPGKNWYMINVQELDSSIDITNRPFTELISDENFEDELYQSSFTVFFRDFEPQDTILISLTNISEEYYEFLELRNEQRYQFISELGEPVTYPTNVINGFGFFNAHLPDIRIIQADSL
jgi:hypothetical protein